jgi:AsmA family/AsmA-like C-terminal region
LREFLTGFAIVLIGLLLAALAAPYLYDFSGQRAAIEDALGTALDAPVTIEGRIDIRLLPFPVVKLQDVTIGDPIHGSSIRAANLDLDVATMPLLKGAIQVMDAEIDAPILSIMVSSDGTYSGIGRSNSKRGGPSSGTVSIDSLMVHKGSVYLAPVQAGATPLADGLELTLSTGSLSGPWRVDGRGYVSGRPTDIKISTGSVEAGSQMRVRAILDGGAGGSRAELDGNVNLGTRLGFDGRVSLAGQMHWPAPDSQLLLKPWNAQAALKIDGSAVSVTSAELSAGGDEGGFKFTGSGAGSFGSDAPISLIFDARQLDLDRPLQSEAVPHPTLPSVLSAWRNTLLSAGEEVTTSIPIDLTIAVEGLIAGGETVRKLQIDAHLDQGGVSLKRGEALLPGNSKLMANGDVGLSEGGSFFGHILFSSKEFGRFGGWIDGNSSTRSLRFGEARDVAIEGDLAASSTLFAASNLKVRLDQSGLSGIVRYALPEGTLRGRLDAQLVSDGFDLDQLPEASFLAQRLGLIDASIIVDARNVRASRVQDAHAGRLQLKATASDEGLVIDTLNIDNIGGANLRASGRLTAAGDRVEATVDAKDAAPIAVLFRKVFPGTFSTVLADRAGVLSPLALKITAERSSDPARPIVFAVNGTASTTNVTGSGKALLGNQSDQLDMIWDLQSPDAAQFLRQAGLSVLPVQLDGGGRAHVALHGAGFDGLTVDLAGRVAGADFSSGMAIAPQGDGVSGHAQLSSLDVQPIMQAIAWPTPDPSLKLPISGSMDFAGHGLQWRGQSITMDVAGRTVTGDVSFDRQTSNLTGNVVIDSLSLPELGSLALGSFGVPQSGALWSSNRFSPPGPPPVDVSLTFVAKQFGFGFGEAAHDARFNLVWKEDGLDIRDLDAALFGGHVTGNVGVKRLGSLGSYLAKMKGTDLSLASLIPGTGLSGKADVEFDGGGSGESVAALVSSLSGGGTIHSHDLSAPGLDPSAVGKATLAFDSKPDAPDLKRVNDMIATDLTARPLMLKEASAPLTLSGGIARIGPVEFHAMDTVVQSSLLFDLRALRLDGRASLFSDVAPKDWTGPPPQAQLTLRGVIGGSLFRDVDAGNLANLLATRAVARELARLEAQEADLKEKSLLMRRLKLQQEREDETRQALEAQRVADDAKKAEDARRDADEKAKKATEDAQIKTNANDASAQQPPTLSPPGKTTEQDVLDGVKALLGGEPSGPSGLDAP